MLETSTRAQRRRRGDTDRGPQGLRASSPVVMVVTVAAFMTVAVVLATASFVLVGVRTAWAHSGLAAASPGPGAVVGGEIDVVQLFYGDIILEFEATLTSPSGEVLDAEPVMLSEITAELRLAEPLTEPGEYALRHTILSFDDDVVEAAYLFTYEPEADPPILIFIEEDDGGGGWAWWVWAIIGAGVVLIIVLSVRLVLAVRRAARTADHPTTDDE